MIHRNGTISPVSPHSPHSGALPDLLNRPAPPQSAPPVPPLLIDVPETARRLGVSPRTVERMIERRELPIVRIGRRRMIAADALAGWVHDRIER
jgi:excisionase family DNA binding protein